MKSIHNRIVIAALLVSFVLACGCAARRSGQLRVNPNGSGLPVATKFPIAFTGVNDNGDTEIVLVSESSGGLAKQGKILYPTNATPLKQIVHIRLLWKPRPGTRGDQPSATNATINWYVRSNMSESSKVDYAGAGFVNYYPSKSGARIDIRSSDLALREQSGDLVDPFGKPSLTGSFDAVRNDGMVRDILASLQTRVASNGQ